MHIQYITYHIEIQEMHIGYVLSPLLVDDVFAAAIHTVLVHFLE